MVNYSQRQTRTRRTSYRKTLPMKFKKNYRKTHRERKKVNKGGKKTRRYRKKTHRGRKKTRANFSPNQFIKSDRVVTTLSEVAKHPVNYITDPTIQFHLGRKTLDPIDKAQMSSIAAHIGLDASEM